MAWSLQTDWWRASHLALLHLTPNRHSVQPLETVCFVWVFVGCISCLDSPAAMMTATVDDMYFCFPFWTHRLCEWKHPLLRRIISISSTGLFIHVAHKSIAIGSTCIPNVCASQQRLAMHATHHCACDLMGVNFKKWKHTYVFFDFDGETGIFRYFTLKHNSVVIDSGIRLWKKKIVWRHETHEINASHNMMKFQCVPSLPNENYMHTCMQRTDECAQDRNSIPFRWYVCLTSERVHGAHLFDWFWIFGGEHKMCTFTWTVFCFHWTAFQRVKVFE